MQVKLRGHRVKFTYISRKGGILAYFENHHDFQGNSLNLTLISKQISCPFWRQPWLQGNMNFSQVTNILLSHSWILKRVWILSSWMVLLNNSLEWFSCCTIGVLIVCARLCKYQCCIFLQRSLCVPWFVLLSKLCLCKWEVISLIGHAFKLSVDDAELSIWEDEDVTVLNIPWAWRFPVNC